MKAFDQVFDPIREKLADAQAYWSRLTQRERTLVSVAGGAVLVFALLLTFVSFNSAATTYRRRTEEKLKKLAEVQQLAASYREAEGARQALEQQLTQSDIRLRSYVLEKGNSVGLDIPIMNPKPEVALDDDGKIVESAIELTLTEISLPKLVSFLSTVESGPGLVKVRYLRLEPRPAQELLTANLIVATYKMKP